MLWSQVASTSDLSIFSIRPAFALTSGKVVGYSTRESACWFSIVSMIWSARIVAPKWPFCNLRQELLLPSNLSLFPSLRTPARKPALFPRGFFLSLLRSGNEVARVQEVTVNY